MSKKHTKTPATSNKVARKTEAPKMLARTPDVASAVEVTRVVEAPTPSVVAPVVKAPAAPDREQIARAAFARFVARGYVHGKHVEDWLAAEAELRGSR